MRKVKIERKIVIPIYEQLETFMREDLISGKVKPNSQLPTEPELAKQYRVSRDTVRKVLSKLTEEGLVNRRKGKGTFAADPQVLKSKKHKSIGLYLAGLGTQLTQSEAPSNYAIVHGITNVAENRGYHTVILGKKRVNLNLKKVKEANVDGLIVSGVVTGISAWRRFIPVLKNSNIPYILMDRYALKEDINYIERYSADEIYKTTQYLIKLGHKKIAGIGYKSSHLIEQNFYTGFRRALQEKNIYNPLFIAEIEENTEEELLEIIKSFYVKKNSPTAIFLFYEPAIDNLLLALKRNKIDIPDDTSLIVASDEQMIKDGLKITTIGGISKTQFGEKTASVLIDLIEEKIKPPVNKKLKLKLLGGESCRSLEM